LSGAGEKRLHLAVFPRHRKEAHMAVLLAVLLIIVLLFILGFWVVKLLIWVALIMALLWLIGFFVRGSAGHRWYRW
jgi:hypothetical protein